MGKGFSSVTIEVTQDDIDAGIPKDPAMCPIAVAVRRQFQPTTCIVGFTTITLHMGKGRFTADLPKEAERFVYRYDDMHLYPDFDPKPFTFTTELVSADL